MRTRSFFTSLLLSSAIGFSQYAFADIFCPVTTNGKIRIDQCKYGSNEECKQASESKRDCVADQLASSSKAPYCLVMGAFEVCDKYQDYESCAHAAEKQAGSCIVNPSYKTPGKL